MKYFLKKFQYSTFGFTIILAAFVFLLGFSSPANATCGGSPTITFDRNLYFIEHGAVITVTDPSANTNPSAKDTIQVKVESSDPGFTLTFTETDVNTGIFKNSGYIIFTTGIDNQVAQILHVVAGTDKVKATYCAVAQLTADTIKSNDWGSPVPINVSRQPDKTVKLTCANDVDSDGICDEWESSNGISIPYDGFTFTFSCPTGDTCGGSDKPDVWVEVDGMKDQMPDPNAIGAVKTAFLNKGVRLHVLIDNELDNHTSSMSGPAGGGAGGTMFDQIKSGAFGTVNERAGNVAACNGQPLDHCVADLLTAKRQVFHYALFAYKQTGSSSESSGVAEWPGNDLAVTLGPLLAGYGSVDQQQGAFMHELGHNLNLNHGGGDGYNCKPNYPSVMSYAREFSDIITSPHLDYSSGTLNPLNEAALSEPTGVTPTSGMTIDYAPAPPLTSPTNTGIDWDRNSAISGTVAKNIHYLPTWGCNDNTQRTLNDYNDWQRLSYNLKTPSAFLDGAGPSEPTADNYEGPYTDVQSCVRSDDPNDPNSAAQDGFGHCNNHTPVSYTAPIGSSTRLVDYSSDSKAGLMDKKIEPKVTTLDQAYEDAKMVIGQTKTLVMREFADASIDVKTVLQDNIGDLGSSQGAKLEEVSATLMKNLSSASTNAQKDLDKVLSSKTNKDKVLVNASRDIDNSFAGMRSYVEESFADKPNGNEHANAKNDILNVLADEQGDVDKLMADARTDPKFLYYLYVMPDNSTIANNEITMANVRDMRLSRIDTLLNYTILRLDGGNFTTNGTSSKLTFNDDLVGVYKLVKDDDLISARDSLQKVRTLTDGYFGGDKSDDLINNAKAQGIVLALLDDIDKSYQIGSTPSQGGTGNYSTMPEIPWWIWILVAIIIGLSFFAGIMYHRRERHNKTIPQ